MKHPAVGLAIVGLGASLAPLDIAVNVALPAITSHFRLALGDVQWLVICYVLVYGSLMLVCGKLGDLFGHRLICRIGRFSCGRAPARASARRWRSPAHRLLPHRCSPRAGARAPWRASAWRCRWPPPSVRCWAVRWSSCGAGLRSIG